jgi:hypothetical protein
MGLMIVGQSDSKIVVEPSIEPNFRDSSLEALRVFNDDSIVC